ncbi:MAG: Zn-dependent hydrolase [Kaiparowitsia implicata GSE-PSE-MK54-09C]|jgi:N-carbamoyl-L-amino-acid hydrolase|nr:Zn-dependent hydrolase [Kaiparowitsia implicata GSE-PSE-MK54-09C]
MPTLARLCVKGDRLLDKLDRLAKIGRSPNGAICRLAFTPEDLKARYLVQQWMMDAGMTVRTDAAGNIIGRYAGQVEGIPAIATGSHIDTVPSGGAFDGALGVLAGLEVVATLHEANLRLNHPVEVIIFADEEDTMIGSRGMAGTAERSPENYVLRSGLSIIDSLDSVGGDWQALPTAQRSRADLAAFVELHVEQGAVLESQGTEIGVVQGVVGMLRSAIRITGQANHAGTTPMDMRQDALVAAAQIVLSVQDVALRMPSDPVATVGYLTVAPNAVNIVPGQVELSVDIRDLSQVCMEEMQAQLERELRAIATSTHTTIDLTPMLRVPPSPAVAGVQRAIAAACTDLGLSHCAMPSRAGHDAMEMGRITDMGMIFVPSQEGLSHSGREYTAPEQCIQGANVLLQTLMRLDSQYPLAVASSSRV